jgi:hypothetical protein
VSAREWRAVREGETHAASKTSTNNTPESFIVGIGASGALLAGAAIVFVTLVGLVSFNVWPTGGSLPGDQNVELSTATPKSSSAGITTVPVSAASGQLASASAGSGSSSPGTGSAGVGGGNGGQGTGGGKGGQPKGTVTSPPATTPAPSTGSGDSGGPPPATSVPGTASKSPAHPVHPTHPGSPHQNISDGTQGKDDGSGNSRNEVTGKGPLSKPPSDSDSVAPGNSGHSSHPGNSSHSGNSGNSTSHGSSKSKH